MGKHTTAGESPRGARGFTLVEIVLVTLLLGILAGVATPKFAGSLRRVKAEAACRRIASDLLLARHNAIDRSSTQAVQFNVAGSSYTLPSVAHLDRANATYSVSLGAAPYQAELVSAVLGADAEVVFDQYGQPDSGGVVTVRVGTTTGTVTLNATSGLPTVP